MEDDQLPVTVLGQVGSLDPLLVIDGEAGQVVTSLVGGNLLDVQLVAIVLDNGDSFHHHLLTLENLPSSLHDSKKRIVPRLHDSHDSLLCPCLGEINRIPVF